MKRINVLQPTCNEEIKAEMLKVLDSGWWQNGPKVKEFEDKFAEYVGAKYAIAVNSATSGLDLCLKAYDIKGGELITPAFSFVSDASVGEWNGMDVTFCDINPRTFCLDPESLVITENTKAIIAVDCHGRLADIDAIRAKAPNVLIIEDAAHAMYTPGAGKGDITVWSFQAVKTMPTGDGGMITTNDESIMKKLRSLYWLGVEKLTYERVGEKGYTWDYDIKIPGIKAYMIDLTAVIGLGQLKRLEGMNARRREIQESYNQAFDGYDWFKKPEFSHTVQYYTPEWKDRDGLHTYLAELGIHTGVHFKPISYFTYWKKGLKRPLPNTEVWHNILSLPVHSALTDEDQDFIIEKVKEFYAKTS